MYAMKRKMVSFLLVLLLLAGLVPQGVFAAETEMLPTTAEEKHQSKIRTTQLDLRNMESTSNAAEGWSWDSENSILTLDSVNFVVGDSVYAIRMNSGTIVLRGENTVTCTYDDGREDKGISVSVVGAIYASNKNLIFEGPGSLNVSSTAYGGKGIYTWRGNVTVNGGTITATGGTSIRRNGSSCGIECGSLTVNGGSFTAVGRNSNGQSVGIDTYPGGLIVNGGTVRASSGAAQNEAGFNMPSSAIIARSIDIGNGSITEPSGAYITSYKDDNATMQIIASASGETATNVVINGRSSISLLPGQTANPRVTLTPSDAKVSWTSSRSSVARVSSDGTITGVAPGTATITGTATLGNQKKTITCAVIVNQSLLIGWTKTAANLKVGDLESLSFTYQPTDSRVSVTSSNPSVIKVEGSQYSQGKGYTTIRAVGGGSATITAKVTADGQEKTATVTIYVESDAEEIAQRFVDVALAQDGKTAANYGFLGRWCDEFISWCANQVGAQNIIPEAGDTGHFYTKILAAGGKGEYFYNKTFKPGDTVPSYYRVPNSMLGQRNTYTPEIGDIVFVLWPGDYGKYNISHVGIVYDVNTEERQFRMVDGNTGNGDVEVRSYYWSYDTETFGDGQIVAYARPNWSAATGITSGTRNLVSDCPVDVQVAYNGEVLDSATGQLSASFGSMTVTGEGDGRSVSLNLNDYYDVETWINGTGTGTMTFTTTSKDEDGTVGTRTFRNVPITPSTLIRVVQSGTARDAVTLEIYANGGDTVTSVWYADSDTPSVSSANSDLTEWYLSDTSEPTDNLPFTDVASTDWFYSAVQYVYENSIMNGTSATTFVPNGTVERSQVVQMLYNLEGQPTVTGNSGFSDIKSGDWYSKAVIWAERTGVVDGYENNTFRPGKAVSREEFAQMLYNYAVYKGYDLSAAANLARFPDGKNVSAWAEKAMCWANGNELINGHDDGRLDPGGTAIRAQAASILMRFDQNLVEN